MQQFCSGLIVFFIFSFQLHFAEGGEKGDNLNKAYRTSSYTHFTINNISSWFYANGDSDQDPSGNSGLIYPKGSGKACVFETGFVWGGIIDKYTGLDSIRVGGSTYRSSLKQGRIKEDGSAMDPADPRTRIYRVRPDYKTADLSDEIKLSGQSYENVLAQYELDWLQWPAEWGAPFEDINNNGIYEPDIDIPGITGAHQTLWFVANDLDAEQSRYMYGSDPLGLEMQTTIWGYNASGPLGNTLFREYKIFNKGEYKINKMYFGLWSDVDLGSAGDDNSGCDTTLDLSYVYNGTPTDLIYDNSPPALGFTLLKGPVTVSGDTLEMTASPAVLKQSVDGSWDTGDYNNGTLKVYNQLQGFDNLGKLDQVNGEPTKFVWSGPPATGYLEFNGSLFSPSDKRIMNCTGPVTLVPGSFQSIIFAEIVAGVTENETNLQAVYKLKDYTNYIRKIYSTNLNWIGERANITPKFLPKDNKIFLYWGEDSEKNNYIETTDFSGYKFQGYNIYQLPYPDSKLEEGLKVATFDKNDGVREIFSGNQILQTGTDSGVKREILLERDLIKDEPLYNYNRYYFAVTAYFYSDSPALYDLQVFETEPQIIEAVPGKSDEGIELNNQPDDLISVSHSGNSNADLIVKVINPEELQNKRYKVKIEEEGWRLFDVDSNYYINNDIINYKQASTDDYNSFYKNGLEIFLYGSNSSPRGLYKIINDALTINYYKDKKWHGDPDIFDFLSLGKKETTSKYVLGYGTDDPDILDDNYNLFFNCEYSVYNDILVVEEGTGSLATIIGTEYFELSDHPLNPEPGSNKPFAVRIPFEIWNTKKNEQVNILFYDRRRLSGMEYDYFTGFIYDCFILNTPYQETAVDTSAEQMNKCTWAFRMNFGLIGSGKNVELIFNNRLIPGEDEFSFSTQAPTYSIEKAKEDADQINVFPNPLYGYNTNNLTSTDRFMTFTHLPNRAEIIIFNLAGQYVTKLNKNDDKDFMVWDLTNDNNILVGSGIYIVRVHLPDLGKTKILKAAIIQTYY